MPSAGRAVRRMLGGVLIGSDSSSGTETAARVTTTTMASSEEKQTMTHQTNTEPTLMQETADPDAPVALLLPGLSGLLVYNPPPSETSSPNRDRGQTTGVNVNNHADSTSDIQRRGHPTTAATTLAAIEPVPIKDFTPKPSKTANLIVNLPLEVQAAIFAQPNLDLNDMMNLRKTCRTWRRDIPISILDKKLSEQNHAGWQIVFEMNGHKYPGTTYGNRRLCGRCVLPRIRGNLISGDCVRRYLTSVKDQTGGIHEALREGDSKDGGTSPEGGESNKDVTGWWEWDEDRGMCFPCLWAMLAAYTNNANLPSGAITADSHGLTPEDDGAAAGNGVRAELVDNTSSQHKDGTKDKSKWRRLDKKTKTKSRTEKRGESALILREKDEKAKNLDNGKLKDPSSPSESSVVTVVRALKLAAVEKNQQFTMMDGTIRKICDVPACLRDIHENAVPCPHCTDFSEWCRRRRGY